MSAKSAPKQVVALDWDARSLRVVHAAIGKRGVKVERVLSAKIPPEVDQEDAHQLGAHIRRVLDQQHIHTRPVIVDIPRDKAVLNTLHLPVAAPDELPGMVEIQVAKELPFAISEAVVDFATPAPSDAGTSDVVVAAVRREALAHYEAVAHAAGLRLHRLGLRPHASKVAICTLLKESLPPRVLFIDVMPTLMEIDVLHEGRLAFSRAASVSIPPRDSSDAPLLGAEAPVDDGDTGFGLRLRRDAASEPADAVVRDLVMEVTRSIEAYRSKDQTARIDHVIVGGGVGVEQALSEALQRRLHVTAELYNPARTFGWSAEEGAEASAFASTLGLALGQIEDATLHFDFLNPKRTVSQTREKLKKAPMAAAAAVLLVVSAGVFAWNMVAPSVQQLERIEKQITELDNKKSDYRQFTGLMEEAVDFDEGQLIWVDVLYDLFEPLPSNKDLVLSEIVMDQKERQIVLKTRAKHWNTATDAAKDLQAYRRVGPDGTPRTKPRFKVSVGAQTEKKGEDYPFVQDLRVQVLRDEPRKKNSKSVKGKSEA